MIIDASEWTLVDAPGYAGTGKASRDARRDQFYGPGNWKTAFRWGEVLIERAFALKLYEDAYWVFLRDHPTLLDWLCATARDVYDNAPSNVASGLDYRIQETKATHLQDIAIRNALLRLGCSFQGDHLVEIRGQDSEGYALNPGRVPFHLPERIVARHDNPGWIQPGSIEDFWQSNKVLVVRRSTLRPVLTVDVIVRNEAGRILLIDRETPPEGWALPGGKLEFGESLREGARREVKEETGLDVEILESMQVFDAPERDPRHHMVSVVFVAQTQNASRPAPGQGVKRARFFAPNGIPDPLVFDHRGILDAYFHELNGI